jgi:hypothetical protein
VRACAGSRERPACRERWSRGWSGRWPRSQSFRATRGPYVSPAGRAQVRARRQGDYRARVDQVGGAAAVVAAAAAARRASSQPRGVSS